MSDEESRKSTGRLNGQQRARGSSWWGAFKCCFWPLIQDRGEYRVAVWCLRCCYPALALGYPILIAIVPLLKHYSVEVTFDDKKKFWITALATCSGPDKKQCQTIEPTSGDVPQEITVVRTALLIQVIGCGCLPAIVFVWTKFFGCYSGTGSFLWSPGGKAKAVRWPTFLQLMLALLIIGSFVVCTIITMLPRGKVETIWAPFLWHETMFSGALLFGCFCRLGIDLLDSWLRRPSTTTQPMSQL